MQIDFSEATGRFNITSSVPSVGMNGATAWASYRNEEQGKPVQVAITGGVYTVGEDRFTDVHGSGTQRTLSSNTGVGGIELIYRVKHFDSHPFALLQVSIRNFGPHPVYLHECCLLDVKPENGGELKLGADSSGLRFFKVGWHGWDYSGWRTPLERNSGGLIEQITRLSYTNPVTRRLGAKGEFSSEGWCMLADASTCIVAGFASTAVQFGQVYACVRPREAALSLVTQMDGVRLDPGEQRDSEWGYLEFVSLPHAEPAARYIEAVGRQMTARVPVNPPPPMWTHWYQFYHDITELRFIDNLDLLSKLRGKFPCQVAELDDGYQQAWGDWTSTNEKFPHGLEWLAEQVRHQGYTAGLWLAPFAVQAKSELLKNHPEWLVKNRRGKPARAGFLYNMFIYALDLTQPVVLDHLQRLAERLTQEWDFSMLKIDFLNAGAIPGWRYDPKLTRAEALRNGLEAIRAGAGDQTFLLGCGCPFGPAVGIVDAMRISPDTAPSWEPYFHWLEWAGPLLRGNPNMPALRNAMRNTLNLSSLHQKWWWNDPDCLLVRETGSRLTEAEVQSAVTLVGLSGGMLISSDDLQQVSEQRLDWMCRLMPNLGLRSLPFGLLEKDMPSAYRVKLKRGEQEWQLVALFNWKDQPALMKFILGELGYPKETRLHVFDYWEEQYQQTEAIGITFGEVPAHGCKLLRVCAVGQGPQVVGDTLHISMGAEIASLRIVDNQVEIGLIEMGRQVAGKVWVWVGDEVIEKEVRK